ncbi:hypothetical protein L0156_27115 [bacterium]|nr:hypothetical protein [bacterium]
MANNSRNAMISVLPAENPHPSIEKHSKLFDGLVGAWDCDFSSIGEDGKITRFKGELFFGWILDGRALQDIWISFPRDPSGERNIGTTIRFYDTKAGIWRVVFIAPSYGGITTLTGGAEGDRIVLNGNDSDGSLLRWSFNEIKQDSFVWRGEISRDQGKTWFLAEEHHMTRRTRNVRSWLPKRR